MLIEILIGLSLATLLLTALFSSISNFAKLEKRLEKARSIGLARQHLHVRLQDLFSGLSRSEASPPLYSTNKKNQQDLVAVYYNGIDPDPAFSGDVVGRIYLDEEKNLCLATWPLGGEQAGRKEILFPKASEVSFKFFGPEKRGGKEVCRWHEIWPKERFDIPFLVRLYLKPQEGPILQYAFLLPASPIITYQEKEGGVL